MGGCGSVAVGGRHELAASRILKGLCEKAGAYRVGYEFDAHSYTMARWMIWTGSTTYMFYNGRRNRACLRNSFPGVFKTDPIATRLGVTRSDAREVHEKRVTGRQLLK